MIDILMIFFSILGTGLVLFGFRRAQLDTFRADLFQLRHELFMLTEGENELKFDSDFYRSFENLINSSIRFAHRISYTEIILFELWFKKKYPGISIETSFEKSYNKKIMCIKDTKLKNKIVDLNYRMQLLFFKHLFKTSPLFAIIVLCTFLRVFIKNICAEIKKNYNVDTIFKQIRGITMNEYTTILKSTFKIAEDQRITFA